MALQATRLHWRDLRFIAIVLATLICIAGQILGQFGGVEPRSGAWRRIDLGALESRLQSGDLLRHEAAWYHPLPEREGRPAGDKR